ncbi:MAG: nitroreductase family protein [FCB group bacterium]|jgi:nitroreductase|nr:nitroreductase family protein [FCB group bacterium]
MDAIEALRMRRSVREFRDDPVPREILEEIVDCGRLAPTAINLQPWEFVVVTDPALRKQIADATDHGPHIAAAPVCVAVFCKDTKYYLEDGCAATENIMVAARAHGLGTCWIAGDKKPYVEAVRKLLGAPEGYRLVSLVPVGYPMHNSSPSKRPLHEVLHWERFDSRPY